MNTKLFGLGFIIGAAVTGIALYLNKEELTSAGKEEPLPVEEPVVSSDSVVSKPTEAEEPPIVEMDAVVASITIDGVGGHTDASGDVIDLAQHLRDSSAAKNNPTFTLGEEEPTKPSTSAPDYFKRQVKKSNGHKGKYHG